MPGSVNPSAARKSALGRFAWRAIASILSEMSNAITRPTSGAIARVSLPTPHPISTTVSPVPGAYPVTRLISFQIACPLAQNSSRLRSAPYGPYDETHQYGFSSAARFQKDLIDCSEGIQVFVYHLVLAKSRSTKSFSTHGRKDQPGA